jgi:putative transposase
LNPAEDGEELRRGIDKYFKWYNNKRRHQSLEYRTPSEVYFGSDNAEDKLSRKQLRK